MDTELIKRLLEAGAHFGHNRSRWNPKMRGFIFGERSKIYIVDLEKTVEFLNKARDFVKDIAAKGEMILFVGTKKQAQDVIYEAAQRSGMYYVRGRWLGGTLTNFKTIRNSIKRLKDIEAMEKDGTLDAMTKKEKAILIKESQKLKKNLEGIVEMKKMPGAVFVVDAKKENIAVREARKLSIPVVAIVDTNADPDIIDYPIPANDDAMRSIKLIVEILTEGILEGKKEFEKSGVGKKSVEAEESEEVKEAAEVDQVLEDVEVKNLKAKEEKKPIPPRPRKKTYKSKK